MFKSDVPLSESIICTFNHTGNSLSQNVPQIPSLPQNKSRNDLQNNGRDTLAIRPARANRGLTRLISFNQSRYLNQCSPSQYQKVIFSRQIVSFKILFNTRPNKLPNKRMINYDVLSTHYPKSIKIRPMQLFCTLFPIWRHVHCLLLRKYQPH